MVRVPVTLYLSLPAGWIDSLLKVISGYFSTSKKSAERRCVSRLATPVSMLVALMWNSTEEVGRFLGSSCTVPEKALNRPRTWLTRWRIWNDTSEWLGSMAKVSARNGRAARVVSTAAANSLRFIGVSSWIQSLCGMSVGYKVVGSTFRLKKFTLPGSGADRVQHPEKLLLLLGGEHGDRLGVGGVDRLVQPLDQLEPGGGEPAEHLAPVLGAALAAHQALHLQAVEQPGHPPRPLDPAGGGLHGGA